MEVWHAAFFYSIAVALTSWVVALYRRDPKGSARGVLASLPVLIAAAIVLVGSYVVALEPALFYFFALSALIGAVLTVSARHPIHGSIFLLLTAISLACLFVLLSATLMATIYVILVASAVVVFYLAAIMMVEVPDKPAPDLWLSRHTFATVVGLLLFVGLCGLVAKLPSSPRLIGTDGAPPRFDATTAAIGSALYGDLLLPFLASGVLLLTALVGSVYVAKRESSIETGSAE